MSVYALVPLIATIAYVPLLFTTAGSRPWQKRHVLFFVFLMLAMSWSFTDYLFRSGYFPKYNQFIFEVIVFIFVAMAVQFHVFTSSFFPAGKGRWLPFAWGSLAVIAILIFTGNVTGEIVVRDDIIHGSYTNEIYLVFVPLLVLVARNYYVFWRRMRNLNNPVMFNQIVALILGISVLTLFALFALIPWGREYPIVHFGNLINAFILSYAVIRHRLLDIRLVLRQGTAWLSLGIVGLTSYWLLLIVLHFVLNFELSLMASFVATLASLFVAVFVYRLRGSLFDIMSRVFQGTSYEHRQKLADFTNTVHNLFSLKEQGGELLALLTRAIGIKQASLLFPETGSNDFKSQFVEPKDKDNELADLKLTEGNPIIKYLETQQKPLTREKLGIMPEFLSMWAGERQDIKSKKVELMIPLISRNRLIAILVLGEKHPGRYSLEDMHLIEDVTSRVAVSMEKEYLWEQLRQREKELEVINRSSVIIASSLDIQGIYDTFFEELKKVVDVTWAAIVLKEGDELRFLAISSEADMDWHVGEKVPFSGSGTEWVVSRKEAVYEPDIEKESRFEPVGRYLRWGLHSVVHLPLLAKGEAIGSFIVASRKPEAYSPWNIALLEQLASQIAMPVENARLYAQAEEKARIDELTGLLNRRSLNEMIDGEINRHSRYGGVFSLAILDLDSFKKFNDNYGHLAGDELLRQVGQIIRNDVRGSDRAFRYGGDEFAIVLPQTTIDAAGSVVERVREKIAAQVEDRDVSVTASIGLASWPADGIGQIDIIAAADVALYHAKRGGGNQSQFSSGALLPLDAIEPEKEDAADNRNMGTIYAMAEVADARGAQTCGHSKKVTEYALALAEAIKMDSHEVRRLEACALLHDVGKIGISEEILNKPGELNAEEWEVIKTHSQMGAAIVSRVHQLAPCVAAVRHHHEWYDGSGYPDGLKGDDIPLEARILAIADAFAAMIAERPYATTLTQEEALEEIRRGAGKQFDPYLVESFLSIYGVGLTSAKKKVKK